MHNLINGYGRYLRQRKIAAGTLHESGPNYACGGEADPFEDPHVLTF